jgi:hypothetical protein
MRRALVAAAKVLLYKFLDFVDNSKGVVSYHSAFFIFYRIKKMIEVVYFPYFIVFLWKEKTVPGIF